MDLLIEKQIQVLISKGDSCELIAKQLLKKKSILNNSQDFLSVCKFMYLSGLHKLLIKTSLTQLKQQNILPWGFIIKILDQNKIKLSKQKKMAFINGIIEQHQINAILTVSAWDKEFPQLKSLKQEQIKQINLQTNKVLIQLKKDLIFVQSQGILKKEKEILKELKKLQPDDLEIKDQWSKYLEKWGREIIKQKKTLLIKQKYFSNAPPKIEQKQAENMAKSVQQIVKTNPEISYNMGLLFSFMGYPKLALKILKYHLNNISALWFYLDLLIESKLFLECLPILDQMETKYSQNPETIFALTYIRAQAYYGLGKKNKAKNMLSDLLEIRPNYRLTHYLLKQWEKETS